MSCRILFFVCLKRRLVDTSSTNVKAREPPYDSYDSYDSILFHVENSLRPGCLTKRTAMIRRVINIYRMSYDNCCVKRFPQLVSPGPRQRRKKKNTLDMCSYRARRVMRSIPLGRTKYARTRRTTNTRRTIFIA